MFDDESIIKGRRTHEYLQEVGLPDGIREVIRKTDKDATWILDYKTGSLSGYEKQLNNYGWMVKWLYHELGEAAFSDLFTGDLSYEQKIYIERPDYQVIGVPDVILKGKDLEPRYGALIKINPIMDDEGFVVGIEEIDPAKHIRTYELNQVWLNEWDLIYDTMASSILYAVREGRLKEFYDYFIY